MKFGKRQLVLSALVLALGTAIYLNWQFSDDKTLVATNSLSDNKHLGEAKYVNNYIEPTNTEDTQKVTDNPSQTSKEYFLKAQMSRNKARDEALEKSKGALNDLNASDEIKSEALKVVSRITDNITQESNIENLIKAKGFSECMVMIQNGECSVVVSGSPLDENSAIIIKDLVLGQSAVKCENIKIIEAK